MIHGNTNHCAHLNNCHTCTVQPHNGVNSNGYPGTKKLDSRLRGNDTAHLQHSVLCRVDIRSADSTATLSSLTHVISRQSRPAILGGNDSVGRYSIFCAEPVEIFTFEDGQDNPFEKLQSFLEKYKLEKNTPCFSDSPPLPGWIGFFAYPLAHYIEKLPRPAKDDLSLPLIHMAFYDKAIIHDHKNGAFSLVVLDYPGQAQTAD
jgi:anthranilate/para-aminobenzoate synthase component I